MTTENREERPDKVTHRIMGEYSIAKSYKGILRIAHIMELVDDEPDYFLSPTYYGNPKQLLNISGGTYAAKEYGYQTAIKGMQKGGGLERYDTRNGRIGNDPLRLHRVPMTDSMGNYLNWNVGTDGVTIGSNEDINGNEFSITKFKQFQGEKDFIVYQEKIFPILQSRDLTVGMENMMVASNKKGINDTTLSIESGTHDAMLIIENMYDKSPENKDDTNYYRETINGEETEQVTTSVYRNVVDGPYKKYSKLRTIYKNTKPFSEDFDAFMFRQNDFDVNNYFREKQQSTHNDYKNTYNQDICNVITDGMPVRDSIVDVVNLKEYVKQIILKYMKGNVVEVPSGAVIWQYCSLEKWRAHNESTTGDATDLCSGGYPGHRPSLQIKESQTNNIFGASTLQGVCKKINRLRKTSNGIVTPKEDTVDDPTKEDTSSMGIEADSDSLREIIPLYKRDYVLCDGSKYRIPYSAPLQKSTMRPFAEHQNRFFELFFNIGYKYTEKTHLGVRNKSQWDESKNIYVPHDGSSSPSKVVLINELNMTNSCLNDSWFNNFDKLPETPPYSQWYNIKNPTHGYGYPKMIHPNEPEFDNCTDLDVLFQEDLVTMLACDAIYNEYNSNNRLGGKEWNFENVKEWLRNEKLPEEYIFNTFVGDLNEDVKKYFENSKANDTWFTGFRSGDVKKFEHKQPPVMEIEYNYCPDGTKPILPIGREVTYYGSPMKYYDNSEKKFVITSPSNLPMVNFFIYLMCSNHRIDGSLQMYFFSFFNYDFQVPNFMHDNKCPTFIGSGAYAENDAKRHEIRKVQSWTSNFSEGDIPHRHGVFLWTGEAGGIQPPGKPNENWNNPNFTYLPQLSQSTPVALMSYAGGEVTNFGRANKHGDVLYNHDGNGNYIIKPIPLVNEEVKGTSYAPYNLLQSNEETYIGWKTGQGYDEGSSKMVNTNPDKFENFTENTGGDAIKFKSSIHYPYSFSLIDDPRFQNAEPNRGLTSPPIYEDVHKVIKFKDTDALEVFYDTTDINWFSPENIQMLPLIKL